MTEDKITATVQFTDEDFFSELQKDSFVSHFNSIKDKTKFIKDSIIHRALIEQQTDHETYKKLIQHIQIKGVESILNLIEKKEQDSKINEESIERIVNRILDERSYQFKPDLTQKAKQVKEKISDSRENRKKPSKKLLNI